MNKNLNNTTFLTVTNPKTKASLVISPSLGGTIVSLTLNPELYQVLENDTDKELLDNPLFRGRFLFPFNDRIPEGKYSFRGKNYQLPINCNDDGSAIHGFLYNKEVSILKHTETEAVLYWRTGRNQFNGYPFDISLTTGITLNNKGVNIAFTVKNEGDSSAPFALGWHSYFKTDSSSKLIADYPFYYDIDSNYLPVGEKLPSKGSKYDFSNGAEFSGKTLDHTFEAPLNSKSVLKTRDYSIQIKQDNFAYTQLFIPPERKSIAIEPISSKPNSFNSDEVLVLGPGKKYFSGIRVEIV